MNIAIIPGGNQYLSNKLFDRNDEILNRDNCHEYFIFLREILERRGHNVNTYDVYEPNQINLVILYRIDFMIGAFLETIKKNPGCAVFYMMSEPSIICKIHSYESLTEFKFDKIFTWNDDEIRKSDVFVKLNYVNPRILAENIPQIQYKEKQLIATIAGNKVSGFLNELYSERLKVAKYFSGTELGFSLYGRGWGKDKRDWVKDIWKGAVKSKNEVLKNYKFTLCFENSYGYSGYITEKIFDAFAAGSVPIYYGANNITDFVPKEAFIDYREFDSIKDLYRRISEMREDEYNSYLSSAKKFLASPRYDQFCSKHYSDVIIEEMQNLTIKKRNYLTFRLGLISGLFGKVIHIRYLKRYFFEVLTYI